MPSSTQEPSLVPTSLIAKVKVLHKSLHTLPCPLPALAFSHFPPYYFLCPAGFLTDPGMLLPQGLCTCRFLCLVPSFSRSLHASLFTSFRSFLKHHLLREFSLIP